MPETKPENQSPKATTRFDDTPNPKTEERAHQIVAENKARKEREKIKGEMNKKHE
jgi:hypothetical protein